MTKRTTHLSDSDLAKLREALEQKKRELIESLKALEAELSDENRPETAGGGLSDLPTHPADVSTDLYERDASARLLARQRLVLNEVDQALQRLEAGTYGRCLGTGKPIGIERLRAKPWAKYCMDYAKRVREN